MGKFDKKAPAPRPAGPMRTEAVPTLTTGEGAPGYAKDEKAELFTLAVTNMVGEDTFYERAADRDDRFGRLVRTVAVADPAWMLGFVGWLRGPANMRSASLVTAAEAVKARLDAEAKMADDIRAAVQASGVNRRLIAAALQRADEPGELLAYWKANHGRNLPKPVKRGVADAVARLYTEYALLKYDTASHGHRFGDVVDLVHPDPVAPWQGALFRYALDRRHNRDGDLVDVADALPMVYRNVMLRAQVHADHLAPLTSPDALKAAGMTWEDALSLAGDRVPKAALWEAVIPSMGYMALLRNLRNFDEAGVSDRVAKQVGDRLTDPAEVARSRQLPFRFYSAHVEAPSDRWKYALGVALDLAMVNVPELPGRTLVLIDTSGSMTWGTISARSKRTPAEAAAVLGIVLAKRCGADVVQWASTHRQFKLRKGATALSDIVRFLGDQDACGGGTNLQQAMAAYGGHDRVFILSDMQIMGGYRGDPIGCVPAHVPVYAFDLQGYRSAAFAIGAPGRHQLGGFSDAVFSMVPLLERRTGDVGWPWEIPAA